jgi:hypothetical protein
VKIRIASLRLSRFGTTQIVLTFGEREAAATFQLLGTAPRNPSADSSQPRHGTTALTATNKRNLAPMSDTIDTASLGVVSAAGARREAVLRHAPTHAATVVEEHITRASVNLRIAERAAREAVLNLDKARLEYDRAALRCAGLQPEQGPITLRQAGRGMVAHEALIRADRSRGAIPTQAVVTGDAVYRVLGRASPNFPWVEVRPCSSVGYVGALEWMPYIGLEVTSGAGTVQMWIVEG